MHYQTNLLCVGLMSLSSTLNTIFCVANLLEGLLLFLEKTYCELLCHQFTLGKIMAATVLMSHRGSVICAPLLFCNLCITLRKGRGLPQYTQLYVTTRSIEIFPCFPLYFHVSHSSLSAHLPFYHPHLLSSQSI